MKLGMLLWGLTVLGLGCGGSSGVSPAVDAAAPTGVATMDAHPPDLGGAVGAKVATPDAASADQSAAVPTWSTVYRQLLVNPSYASNCTGSSCHDPGVEKGLDLSTPEKGYTSILHRVTPGMPGASELITVLQSGYMPQGRPQMPDTDVAQVSAWIEAGALDN
jgi:hypothetical protein